MKLWISGEIEADIGDSFRYVLNEVETLVNDTLLIKNYGNGINEWDVIMIITQEGGKDSFRYNKKTKDTDVRINIDYNSFKNSDPIRREALFLDHLIRSIDKLKEFNIQDVDLENLKIDLSSMRNGLYKY
jgi:immunity protein 44 of polymorphic toxin system